MSTPLPEITVIIPTIPPRKDYLCLAIQSVMNQTLPAVGIIICTDTKREGAAITRNRALQQVTTPLVACLDDDDEFYPEHLKTLYDSMLSTDADYTYSYFDVSKGGDPLKGRDKEWTLEDARQTTITTLVKTEIAQAAGYLNRDTDPKFEAPDSHITGEDYRFTMRIALAGHKIVHAPGQTWLWRRWGGNTSGRPDRW